MEILPRVAPNPMFRSHNGFTTFSKRGRAGVLMEFNTGLAYMTISGEHVRSKRSLVELNVIKIKNVDRGLGIFI